LGIIKSCDLVHAVNGGEGREDNDSFRLKERGEFDADTSLCFLLLEMGKVFCDCDGAEEVEEATDEEQQFISPLRTLNNFLRLLLSMHIFFVFCVHGISFSSPSHSVILRTYRQTDRQKKYMAVQYLHGTKVKALWSRAMAECCKMTNEKMSAIQTIDL